ncbi:MAG: methyltransferase domain-containing protein [Bacteroidales bacterium]|nr:methyltransferase domain-containing protein [Bacteroidales bacterium]
MSDLLIQIFLFFRKKRILFYLLFTVILALMVWYAAGIRFEENITGTISAGDKQDQTGYVVSHLSQADKIIVAFSLTDSASPPDPDRLILAGEALTDSLTHRFDSTLVRSVIFRASEANVRSMMELALRHLPGFLEDRDYFRIDSMLSDRAVEKAMAANFRILSSPASMVLKERVSRDPLGISNLALVKLKSLQAGPNFDLYDGCVFTKDRRHLLVFINPANPPSETSVNGRLIDGLEEITNGIRERDGSINITAFGSAVIAVANARQLKTDIMVTLMLSFGLIFILVGWYFKDFRTRLLGLLPAVFGAGLALALLSLFQGTISAISLGIGAVILGLIVDYAMYFMNCYRQSGDIRSTIRDMAHVIVICAVTTIGALLCLTFLDSTVLRDLGWFALLSVAGAALFTLLILPQFIHLVPLKQPEAKGKNFIDRMGAYPYHQNKWLIGGLLIAAVVSIFFARHAGFETRMSSMNFMTPALKKAESDLDRITNYKLKNIFMVATGATTEEALRRHDRLKAAIQQLSGDSVIREISDAGPLLISDSLQKIRIGKWNSFWTTERKNSLKKTIAAAAVKAGFRNDAFVPFIEYIDSGFTTFAPASMDAGIKTILGDWLNVETDRVLVPTILRVKETDREKVYQNLKPDGTFVMFDRQSLTEKMVDGVKSDFNRLVTYSMIFVTLLLILSYGRVGLGLMAALPMFGSWLITLGFMGITGSTFNIFNIILSSFIFGLGVDHSILIMRGLQRSLKYGGDEMASYRVSVILSSGATLFGAASMFLARHPALHSIALISLVGMITVVLISFTIEPWIFNKLILERSRQNKFPVTVRVFIKTIVTWGNIVLIAIVMMIIGTIIRFLLPVSGKIKERLFHNLFSALTRAYIAFTFAFDRKLINEPGERFDKPAIIIANHQSLIETPAFLRLHPRMIILTTRWVWQSPVFGPIARLASFFNVDNGIDNIVEPLRKKVGEGFSLLVFPEGHRSRDQRIQRFHRGAFYLAEKLQIDILPILVFGSGDFLPKGQFWGRPNSLRMKILNRVPYDDPSFGTDYRERARNFRQFFIRHFKAFRAEEGDAHYYRRTVALNYTLKGPVLEWYTKTKLRLEGNYEQYNRLLPREGRIYDLGCGYGYIAYMLMMTGPERTITGVDYDPEKIAVASNNFSKNERISFHCADVTEFDIVPADGFILSDVLHYMIPEKQDELLRKCLINLNPGGIILIREADADLKKRHERSKLTEFFSTRTGFNLTPTADKVLYFTTANRIDAIAREFGLKLQVVDSKHITSNKLFLIRK